MTVNKSSATLTAIDENTGHPLSIEIVASRDATQHMQLAISGYDTTYSDFPEVFSLIIDSKNALHLLDDIDAMARLFNIMLK